MEDDLNNKGRRPYRKMTLAKLANQSFSELGPAQPQLVVDMFSVKYVENKYFLNFIAFFHEKWQCI